jgi:hypothetical protein
MRPETAHARDDRYEPQDDDEAPRLPGGSSVPPTPAEEAAAAAIWERRGVLGRLVRIDRRLTVVDPHTAREE